MLTTSAQHKSSLDATVSVYANKTIIETYEGLRAVNIPLQGQGWLDDVMPHCSKQFAQSTKGNLKLEVLV